MSRSKEKDERFKIIVAIKIAEKRKQLGLTGSDVAMSLGLSRVTITNIEGARQIVTLDTIWKLSHLFDCDLYELIPSKEELKPNLKSISMTTTLVKNRLNDRLDELNRKSVMH